MGLSMRILRGMWWLGAIVIVLLVYPSVSKAQRVSGGPEGDASGASAPFVFTPSATPTPLPTSTAIPTVTPTVTPTPTSTPTVTPTPSPVPAQCEITQFSFVRDRWWDSDSQGWNFADLFSGWDTIPPGFSCIDTMVGNAYRATQQRMGRNFGWWYGDDGFFFSLLNPIFGDLNWDRGQNDDSSYWVPEAERTRLVQSKNAFCGMKSVIHTVHRAGNHRPQCVAGHFWLDQNCNRIPLNPDGSPQDPNLRACGNPTVHFTKSSPISLVWDADAENSIDIRFVRFPLDPSKRGSLFTWKASEKLPLVVYDPEHQGVVTRPEQLFGNWTFGGKKTAALSGVESTILPAPWKDGYEALASLDVNADGRISGDELKPLALWFDRNQNGVSERGEVQPIVTQGVTALFYTSDSYDDLSKTVRASKGFEREVDGRLIRGASIDWFGGTSPSATSLVQGLLSEQGSSELGDRDVGTSNQTLPYLKPSTAEASDEPEDQSAATSFDPNSVPEGDRKWGGIWEWRLKGEEGRKVPDGYLVLGFRERQELEGLSLSPTYVTATGGKAAALVAVHNFQGALVEGADSSKSLQFTLKQGASVLRSTARFGADGDSFEGETRAIVNKGGQSASVTYQWVAVRKKG